MTILDTIAEHTRVRVARDMEKISREKVSALAFEKAAAERGGENRFYSAVRRPGISFICEVKKASPSKGIIDPVFDYLQIASEYESAGAEAISCLTEPEWFLGSDEIFTQIRARVQTPMLRKEFVVDEYQLYQAKLMGADCVLLIVSLMNEKILEKYLRICAHLKLAALVETHDEEEIRTAVRAGSLMIGINNRNLRDFSVDLSNAGRLGDLVPGDILLVAESGVKTPEDAAALYRTGADAVLVGEALMRSKDRAEFLRLAREAAGLSQGSSGRTKEAAGHTQVPGNFREAAK